MNDERIPNFEATIFPGLGIKGIHLGATVAEVLETLGEPDKTTEFPDDPFANNQIDIDACVFRDYFSKGISIRFVSEKAVVIFLFSGSPWELEKGEYGKYVGITPEGVTMDSSYNQVVEAYGPPELQDSLNLTNPTISNKCVMYQSLGVEFTFESDSGCMNQMCVYACERKRS